MICTKTAYRDLGMIHWLRVKQRKDRKPRKGPMKIPYWCKDCQAYHLRKVAVLLLFLFLQNNFPVPVLAEPVVEALGEVRESTDERPSDSESNPVRHAVNSRDSGNSCGGENFVKIRVKESKHYDPEQGLIPIKFYGRLC